MKKLKCKVCEYEFVPEKKWHYVSRAEMKVGLSNLAGGMEPDIYDTFDCPQCGCQNIVGGRKRELYMGENVKEETEEEEEPETEEPEVEVEEPIPEPIPEETIQAKRCCLRS